MEACKKLVSLQFKDDGGAIPSNLLQISNTESNSRYQKLCREAGLPIHPARFPAALPEFFVKFLTDEEDLVFDPFAGSNVTGEVCERLRRRWISVELREEYLAGSRFRFGNLPETKPAKRKKRAKKLQSEQEQLFERQSRYR